MEYPREFERISGGLARLKVPGGWIVNTYENCVGGVAEALCFLPDPKHEWKLEPCEHQGYNEHSKTCMKCGEKLGGG